MRLFTYNSDEWYKSIIIHQKFLDDAYYYFTNNIADWSYIVSAISCYIE